MEPLSFHYGAKVLVLGLLNSEIPSQMLSDLGIELEACASIDEVRAKSGESGAALMSEEALTPEVRAGIWRFGQEEPAWSDFPFLLLTKGGGDPTAFWTSGHLSELKNLTLLEWPSHPVVLASALRNALWSRHRQYELRDLLASQSRAVEQLDCLSEVAGEFLVNELPEDLAETVARTIARPLGLEIYIFRLFNKNGEFRLRSFGGLSREEAERFCRGHWNAEVIQRVVLERRPYILEEIQSCDDLHVALLRSMGAGAWICHPLISGLQLIGTLCFGTRHRSKFNHEDMAVLGTVCNQLAVAIARRRVERELQKLNQQLNQKVQQRTIELQETIEQMEAFSYSVAHDLRGPLRTMRGFSQALLEDYQSVLDVEGRDFLRRIEAGAQKMDVLIRDLLEFSRMGRTETAMEEVSVDDVLENVLFQIKEEIAEKNAEIVVSRPLGKILGHAQTLQQTLTNLVGNALKFVAPGVEPCVRIRSERRDASLRLWVEDNGIGIAREHQQKIFGVFERLHGAEIYPGTGIGLAIVAKAVRRMGGSVGVDSVPGKGSRFWVDLMALPGRDSAESQDGKAENVEEAALPVLK